MLSRKMTGNVINPLGTKVLEEIIHEMIHKTLRF